nr:hypothetical protein [Candidatus Saccharibacteria bacterium]
MDNGKLGEIMGDIVASGTPLTAEAVAGVLTDDELAAEIARRRIGLPPEVGSTAVQVSVRSQIESMLPAAYTAYKHNTETINDGRGRKYKIPTVNEQEFRNGVMDTLDTPTLDYMEAVKDESGGKTLWVPKSAPNTELTVAEIITLAQVNGDKLGKPLYDRFVSAAFLRRFPLEALSGNNPNSNEPVTHQFAPSTFTSRLWGNAPFQRDVYRELRAENPGVNIHAPALAHSLGGWAIHADTGLALPTNFKTTYDDSVELEAQPVRRGGDLYVPFSRVDKASSNVGFSWAGFGGGGRAWADFGGGGR